MTITCKHVLQFIYRFTSNLKCSLNYNFIYWKQMPRKLSTECTLLINTANIHKAWEIKLLRLETMLHMGGSNFSPSQLLTWTTRLRISATSAAIQPEVSFRWHEVAGWARSPMWTITHHMTHLNCMSAVDSGIGRRRTVDFGRIATGNCRRQTGADLNSESYKHRARVPFKG